MDKRTTIAGELIAGFNEFADALEAGDDLGIQFNCYQIRLDLVTRAYTPKTVRATRKLLRASQSIFAKFLGVSVKTVSQWEQGLGKPSPIACRFMDEIRSNPKHYVDRLQSAIVPKRGRRKKLA